MVARVRDLTARSERGFTLVELMAVILIISILALAAVLLLGRSSTDAARNSAAQQSIALGTKSVKSAYYGNSQDLPAGAALQSDLDDGEPGITFTAYDAETNSTGPLNVTYTRDWGDQGTVCAKSETDYFYCERTTYGQSRLQMSSETRERGDTPIRSRCVGLSEPSTRACLADSTHPAAENSDATYGWNPALIPDGSDTSDDYLTEVMTDAPSFYCSFDDPAAALPTPMNCTGMVHPAFSNWSGPAGSVQLGQTGAITSDPDSKAAVFDGTTQNSYSVPAAGAVDTSQSQWTAEVWLKKEGGSGKGTPVSYDNALTIRIASTNGMRADWRVGSGSNASLISDSFEIHPGDPWVYVALVWDQPNMSMYVNGVLAKTAAYGPALYPVPTGTPVMRPGYVNGAWSGGDVLTGRSDEVAFYPTALSAARIAAHYTAAGY